jgi:hypothetical protein
MRRTRFSRLGKLQIQKLYNCRFVEIIQMSATHEEMNGSTARKQTYSTRTMPSRYYYEILRS